MEALNNVSITQADGGFIVEVIVEVNGKLYVVNTLRKVIALVKDAYGESKEQDSE